MSDHNRPDLETATFFLKANRDVLGANNGSTHTVPCGGLELIRRCGDFRHVCRRFVNPAIAMPSRRSSASGTPMSVTAEGVQSTLRPPWTRDVMSRLTRTQTSLSMWCSWRTIHNHSSRSDHD